MIAQFPPRVVRVSAAPSPTPSAPAPTAWSWHSHAAMVAIGGAVGATAAVLLILAAVRNA